MKTTVHLSGSWAAVLGASGSLCGAGGDTAEALSLVTCPACREIAEAARREGGAVAGVAFPVEAPLLAGARGTP